MAQILALLTFLNLAIILFIAAIVMRVFHWGDWAFVLQLSAVAALIAIAGA